jgi:hypothetical protein
LPPRLSTGQRRPARTRSCVWPYDILASNTPGCGYHDLVPHPAGHVAPSRSGRTILRDAGRLLSRGQPQDVVGRRGRLVAVALTILIVLSVGDWYQRNRELDRLLNAAEASERIRFVFENQAVEFQDLRESPDPYAMAMWRERMVATADVAATDSLVAIHDVEDVPLMWWHRGLRTARARYLGYALVWQDRLLRVVDDPAHLDKVDSRITATHEVARGAFTEALPTPALFDGTVRVDNLFCLNRCSEPA